MFADFASASLTDNTDHSFPLSIIIIHQPIPIHWIHRSAVAAGLRGWHHDVLLLLEDEVANLRTLHFSSFFSFPFSFTMQSSWVRSAVSATIVASATVNAINLDVNDTGMLLRR